MEIRPPIPPPNIEPLARVMELSNFYGYEFLYSLLVCPVCDGTFNHIGTPERREGKDDYEAWRGRGDLLVIPMDGECGCRWQICLGEHKGETNGFIRIERSCSEKSFLYFIEAVGTEFIKIGRSANPDRRLKQLSTGSPVELRLIGVISGGAEIEKELHKQFDHLRERLEWFRATPELRGFVREAL